jgi:hypothetical protein
MLYTTVLAVLCILFKQAAFTTALICVPYGMVARCFTTKLVRATQCINVATWFAFVMTTEPLQPGIVALWCEDIPSLTVQKAACAADYGLSALVKGVVVVNIWYKQPVLTLLPIFYVAFATSGSTLCRKVHMLLDN